MLYFSETKPTVLHLLEYLQQVPLHVGPVAHIRPIFVATAASRHREPIVLVLPDQPQSKRAAAKAESETEADISKQQQQQPKPKPKPGKPKPNANCTVTWLNI